MKITKKHINDLSFQIIGCAIEVHRELGPGLLESIYEKCFIIELKKRGLKVSSQQLVPLQYKGIDLDSNLRLDIIVEDLIIVELKSVENMIPLFKAQLLSYMKLASKPKGLLINFNSENISSQIVSLVNDIFAKLDDE